MVIRDVPPVYIVRAQRIEYKPNWGMMGVILFCLGFWVAVGTAILKFWG